MKKIVFVLCFLITFSANAKECDEAVLNAVEWRECVGTKNDNALKIAYSNLINTLGDNQIAIDAIKQAQADWEKFRSSSCYYISETDSREAGALCFDDFNKARIKILNGYAKSARSSN